jgi:linker between RRM2 and RRM3 domains in RBM39 protein
VVFAWLYTRWLLHMHLLRARVLLLQGVLGPSSPVPTQCLLLKNMFDPAECGFASTSHMHCY